MPQDDALRRSAGYARLRQRWALEGMPPQEIEDRIAGIESAWQQREAGGVGLPTTPTPGYTPTPQPTPPPAPRGVSPTEPLTEQHVGWMRERLEAQGLGPRAVEEQLTGHIAAMAELGGRERTRRETQAPHHFLTGRREAPGFRPGMSQYTLDPSRDIDPGAQAVQETGPFVSATPPIAEVLAEPAAMTPEPVPVDPSRMPTTDQPVTEAAPTRMFSYIDAEGNRVFTNIAAPGREVESYDEGVEDFKRQALARAAERAMEPQLPQGLRVPPPGTGVDPGRTRMAPTMGRTRGDFDALVRPGRGGFTPSAEVPEAGTITQAEYQNLTPGQQRAYDREFAGWITRLQAEMQVNPLTAYNRAAEQIMQQPEYAAKMDALRANLDKMLEDEQISQENYNLAMAGIQQRIVQEAMMAMGVSMAALDPRTHMRTGVMGY